MQKILTYMKNLLSKTVMQVKYLDNMYYIANFNSNHRDNKNAIIFNVVNLILTIGLFTIE